MTSRYYQTSKHTDETLLEYLYRLNVAGMRAKIHYADGSPEEKRDHVELFINTLGSQDQELASRLTLMEVPDATTLEKKLRARQRGLAHQMKTLFGSNKFRQKPPATTPSPSRAVHAVHMATDEYDSEREEYASDDQLCEQGRDEEDRARLFVTDNAPPGENPRREFDSGNARLDRPKCQHCGSRRHAEGDCWSLLTCQKCAGKHPTDQCLQACKACGDVHEAGKCTLEEFFNQLRQWFDPQKHAGAEVPILDTTFAREVGCLIDTSVTQECVGIRDETYFTIGKIRIEITLAGDLVYYADLWVGDLVGQHAILGMDFMVPAGVRIDAADGTACLPDEVRIHLIGRQPLYRSKMPAVNIPSLTRIAVGDSYDVPLRPEKMAPKLWVTRGVTWVASVTKARVGCRTYFRVTNVGVKTDILDTHTTIAWWTPVDAVPRAFGFVQPGSRKYDEWQNLAYGATAEVNDGELFQAPEIPMTEQREYQDPKSILRRTETEVETGSERRGSVMMTTAVERGSTGGLKKMMETRDAGVLKSEPAGSPATKTSDNVEAPDLKLEDIPEYENADAEVILHESSELFTEDLEAEMAVLPEIPLTADVKIEDLKVGRPADVEPEEAAGMEERLRNALPPAAKGVACDINVGNARPIAQRVRKISSQFREKLADLIRGLISARMVRASKSPWASPFVIIVKENGVDIRLCVDYRLVNSLTQLIIYPMPLVTDLLEDLDKYKWYCSLDMTSGFWVVPMTDRARLISAFITPFGLFEWLHTPFGLCNAPRIYQRLIDNALYGFWKLSPTGDTRDVFNDGDPAKPGTRSVLEWHLSISVEKSEWGVSRVAYLGHEVSEFGLGAKPKNLESLVTLEFPRTLKGLQSFLGSLNYFHRFIPEFAIYATVLYSLSERDFGEYVTDPKARNQGKWVHAKRAFETLRAKIATTPMLRHFDAGKQPVVILYASDWAISAVLAQEDDGMYMPVKFTSRTLKPNELNYNITVNEILALLRVLNDGYTMLVGKTIRVLTRHTTLGWLFRTKAIHERGKEILGTLAACITPRAHVDTTLEEIAPRKRIPRTTTIPVPKIGSAERLHVVSFDASARVKQEGGAFSAIVWELPNWDVVRAALGYAEDIMVNEAEYRVNRTTTTRKPDVLQELVVQRIRLDRVRVAQEEELWISNLKQFLEGNIGELSKREVRDCVKLASQYEVGESGLPYYHVRGNESAEDRDVIMKLVVPETFRDDILHHYHASLEDRERKTDDPRESPGNIVATYPFQVIAMDHIPSLPASHKGNTELLVWVDLFTGFVIEKASTSRTAQTVAESYEEAVNCRFGASEAIRHHREPGFMSDFFRAINRLMGQRQRATLAYRPQANGAAERMVQTITRTIKMYIADVEQRDWDEYAERLTYTLNTAHKPVVGDCEFNAITRSPEHKRWSSSARLSKSGPDVTTNGRRSTRSPRDPKSGSILTASSPVTRALAHMWHGPFRVAELVNTYAARLETSDTPYQLFPIVHLSKLKPVREFPSRPELRLTVPLDERFDYDEELLPEDSWEARELDDGIYEVERILNVREGRVTRYGRATREFKVKWKGYPDASWVDELDLNFGGLLYDFLRQRTVDATTGTGVGGVDTEVAPGVDAAVVGVVEAAVNIAADVGVEDDANDPPGFEGEGVVTGFAAEDDADDTTGVEVTGVGATDVVVDDVVVVGVAGRVDDLRVEDRRDARAEAPDRVVSDVGGCPVTGSSAQTRGQRVTYATSDLATNSRLSE
ncbi:reverse transcriptase, partial [Phytophthora megakarya]